jgi:hypothetical protein
MAVERGPRYCTEVRLTPVAFPHSRPWVLAVAQMRGVCYTPTDLNPWAEEGREALVGPTIWRRHGVCRSSVQE